MYAVSHQKTLEVIFKVISILIVVYRIFFNQQNYCCYELSFFFRFCHIIRHVVTGLKKNLTFNLMLRAN